MARAWGETSRPYARPATAIPTTTTLLPPTHSSRLSRYDLKPNTDIEFEVDLVGLEGKSAILFMVKRLFVGRVVGVMNRYLATAAWLEAKTGIRIPTACCRSSAATKYEGDSSSDDEDREEDAWSSDDGTGDESADSRTDEEDFMDVDDVESKKDKRKRERAEKMAAKALFNTKSDNVMSQLGEK